MLAFSSDGKLWNSGGNAKFDVTLKDDTKATWNTGRGVSDSGLLNWGSSNPKNEKSAPAATLVYEYCCYLPEYPELSPCLIGAYKTSLAPAKKLNTAMLGTRKPAFSIIVQANIKSIPAGNSVYYSPTYNLVGYAAEKDFKIAKELHERYSNISVNVSNYSDAVEHATNDIGLDDEVPF